MDLLHGILGALLVLAIGAWMRARDRAETAVAELESTREKREAMRKSLDHLAEGVVLLDLADAVLYVNPAAAALLDADALRLRDGRVPFARFTGVQQVVRVVEATPPEGTVRRVLETTSPRSGEPPRALSVTLAPAGPDRRLLVIEDLRADAMVSRMRRDFVANASHELKTPIAALIGLLDLLDQVGEDDRPQLLARARRNANSLANMANDLLGLARAEDPEWKPTAERVDVGAAVAEVLEEQRESAAEKQLELGLRVPEEPLELLVDPVCFATIMRNLVGNGVNYTEEGRVDVTLAARPDGGAALTVTDTGPGIDPEALPWIFERFFRADRAHSRATGGTGLGLSIVRNLLRRLGGRISVHSRPGEGTEFRVELPPNPSSPLPGAGQAEFH